MKNYLLPDVIALKAKNGKYLGIMKDTANVGSSPFLGMKSDQIELNCMFKMVRNDDNTYCFQTISGENLNEDWIGFLTTDSVQGGFSESKPRFKLQVVDSQANKVAFMNKKSGFFMSMLDEEVITVIGQQVINPKSSFTVSIPATSISISNIEYNLQKAELGASKSFLSVLDTINSGPAKVEKTIKYSKTLAQRTTWNNSLGGEIGISTTFQAGVPFVADGKIQVSAKVTYNHQWGGSKGTSVEIEDSSIVKIPPNKQVKILLIGKTCHIEVPFSYQISIDYVNGTNSTKIKNGIFKSVSGYAFSLQVQDIKTSEILHSEPLSSWKGQYSEN